MISSLQSVYSTSRRPRQSDLKLKLNYLGSKNRPGYVLSAVVVLHILESDLRSMVRVQRYQISVSLLTLNPSEIWLHQVLEVTKLQKQPEA